MQSLSATWISGRFQAGKLNCRNCDGISVSRGYHTVFLLEGKKPADVAICTGDSRLVDLLKSHDGKV